MSPFKIIEWVNLQFYKLKLLKDMRVHPVFHVFVLKVYNLNTIAGCTSPQLPPVRPIWEDEAKEWEVKKILSS